MVNIVDTVKDRIQKEILTTNDNIITPRIELAVMSTNALSGRDAASVTANLECEEHLGVTASFENISERNNAFHELSVNDETWRIIPGEVSDLSVSGTHFDRQLHTHHKDKEIISVNKV